MLKMFSFRKKYFVFLIGGATLPIVLSVIALHFKGQAIELIATSGAVSLVVQCILIFGILQILGALINTVNDNYFKLFSIREFDRARHFLSPKTLFKHHQNKGESFYISLYQHIPQLFELRASSLNKLACGFVILGLFVFKVLDDKFWLGLIYLPIILGLSWLANRFFSQKYQESIKKILTLKQQFLKSTLNYFKGSKESQYNWGNTLSTWYQTEGNKVSQGLLHQWKITFIRDFFGSFCVDWPYIMCLCLTIMAAATGKLSISQAVIWLGLTDFLVRGNQYFTGFLSGRINARALTQAIEHDLEWLKDFSYTDIPITHREPSSFNFQLLDKNQTSLSLTPGIYFVEGSNGSGKTTLLETLIGYNHDFKNWNTTDIKAIQNILKEKTRIIEKNPVIYDEFKSFEKQVLGPICEKNNLRSHFHGQLQNILPEKCLSYWLKKLELLKSKFDGDEHYQFSQGEKTIISLARALSYWKSEIKVLIIDECDASLDDKTKRAFLATLQHLSQYVAVWMITHNANSVAQIKHFQQSGSFMTAVYLLATNDKEEGFVIPMHITACTGGSGKVEVVGKVAKPFIGVFKATKRAMVNDSPHMSVLETLDYFIDFPFTEFEIFQTRSSGLGIAIALINLYEGFLNGKQRFIETAATGQVLMDGTILNVADLETKISAAKNNRFVKNIITPREISNLKDLYNYKAA